MLPTELRAEQLAAYPPEARGIAVANLSTLRLLPVSFLPSLLREVIEYDYKFPAERKGIDGELVVLHALSEQQRQEWMSGFAALSLSPILLQFDWINQPAHFVEMLSAHLWTTHQQDAFHLAASAYGEKLQASIPVQPLPIRRLGIAVIGQGVPAYDAPLFRKLRQHGTYFSQVKPADGVEQLLHAVQERAEAHPSRYAHWYVEGGTPTKCGDALTCVAYGTLAPTRAALLKNIQTEIRRPGMGPEQLRTHLAQLVPADLGMQGDAVLDRFQMKLLTEGSGTQIFSTTFAQWTSREVLRRAQALTLLVRYAPRQRQRPMNELLSADGEVAELDAVGSLIDGEMGAYYQWINQQRLTEGGRSAFVAWFEGHRQAVVIGPSMPRGTESTTVLTPGELIHLAMS